MPSPRKLLVANRGEIALRIQRSASLFPRPEAQFSFTSVGLYTEDEQDAAHVLNLPAEQRVLLPGAGARAYLDGEAIVRLARENGVWGVAPGYGFLSESAEFARAVEAAGMVWIGPTAEQLALLGDKVKAKQLARQCSVPTLESTGGVCAALEEVQAFAQSLPVDGQLIIKAVNGGGGRGMRVVAARDAATAIAQAYDSCVREAKASFGDERVYTERFLADARHIEVQVIGDGTGDVAHVWERECSLQRRHQKLIEIAPSPTLTGGAQSAVRRQIIDAALRMASTVKYRSLGTFEFLLLPTSGEFFFMEVNPRIQVEHTITEAITSLDLVAIQLQIASGATLKQLGLGQTAAPPPFPTCTAIQLRINAERFLAEGGGVVPTSGALQSCTLPSGPGIRVDTAAYAPFVRQGRRVTYRQTTLFDSLLAKLIVTAPSYPLAVQLARAGLEQTNFVGVQSNAAFLKAILERQEVLHNDNIHTRFVEQHFDELFGAADKFAVTESVETEPVDSGEHQTSARQSSTGPPGTSPLPSPLSGLVSRLSVEAGQRIRVGDEVALLESMKMEHVVRAIHSGVVQQIDVQHGHFINEGDPILFVAQSDGDNDGATSANAASEEMEDVSTPRPDLQALLEQRRLQADAQRTEQVKRRRAAGFLTARENVALLADEGTFIEYGDLMIAAQRTRVDEETLRARTSNDGVITGWATVNADLFDDGKRSQSPARCALCIYDYMVLAGTQGHFHHLKLDRLFRSVLDNPAPLILYAEGGGGRPGDVDLINMKVAGLDTPSFALLAAIRARGYPSIGLANGYTFAGNAALLGTCDIVVATEGGAKDAPSRGATSTGMGGPAMIEGGGLGVVKPQDVGPVAVHVANGDYDVVVPTEKEASDIIKRLLAFFQGPLSHWSYSKDVLQLRRLLPPSRTRAYEVRSVIDGLVDDYSFVELGRGWGHSIVTGLARAGGQPIGVLASSVMSPLGGAIDAASAQKATRLLTMLHRTRAAHLLVLCDTPGFMVGPQAEHQGGLRAFAEMFAAMMAFQDGQRGGRVFAVTLRKAYGLGAQVMLGGSSLQNHFSVAWPQGEYAGMGIEGAVRLGMRKELEAVPAGQERDELFASLVEMMYQRGKAQSMAALAEIDTVIDPAETRNWLLNGLRFTRARTPTWQDESRSSSHL